MDADLEKKLSKIVEAAKKQDPNAKKLLPEHISFGSLPENTRPFLIAITKILEKSGSSEENTLALLEATKKVLAETTQEGRLVPRIGIIFKDNPYDTATNVFEGFETRIKGIKNQWTADVTNTRYVEGIKFQLNFDILYRMKPDLQSFLENKVNQTVGKKQDISALDARFGGGVIKKSIPGFFASPPPTNVEAPEAFEHSAIGLTLVWFVIILRMYIHKNIKKGWGFSTFFKSEKNRVDTPVETLAFLTIAVLMSL